MKTEPIEALTLGAGLALWWAVATIARSLLPLLALVLTLAGWRPAPSPPLLASLPPAPASAPAPSPAPAPLASLPVRELRGLARAAGLPALARSGRRADLLAALGAG